MPLRGGAGKERVLGSRGTGGATRPSFYPNTGTGERVWKGKDDASRGVAIDEATGTAFADGKPLPLSPERAGAAKREACAERLPK